MTKYYLRNSGKRWSKKDEGALKRLANQNTPTPVIAFKLGRPIPGIYAKAGELDVSLKPTNKSPYNRQR